LKQLSYHFTVLHQKSGGAGAKTGGGLKPLSPIASAATVHTLAAIHDGGSHHSFLATLISNNNRLILPVDVRHLTSISPS